MANGDSKFQGLLSSPAFNFGIGLLGAGLSRPRNVGEGLLGGFQAGGSLLQQNLRNQATRDALQQRSRQRDAIAQIREDITRPVQIPVTGGQPGSAGVQEVITPQQERLGLLLDAAPEQFVGGLLGQQFPETRAAPAVVRVADELGLQGQERDEFIRSNFGGDSALLDQRLDALEAEQRAFQLQQEQRKAAQERESEAKGRQKLEDTIRNDIRAGRELVRLNRELEGTAQETGVPFGEFRRDLASGVSFLGEKFGFDTDKSKELVSKRDEFNKIATGFVLSTATRLRDKGAITNFQLQQVRESQVSLGNAPDANRAILADQLQFLLNQADREGIDIGQRGEIEQLVTELRGDQPQGDSDRGSATDQGERRFRFNPDSGKLERIR